MSGYEGDGLYLMHISIHGLVRGQHLELGRDADTGGQIQYVLDLVRALAERDTVERIDLMTRQIFDHRIDPGYAEPEEVLDTQVKARIVRIPFGPRRYLRKEHLWPYLDSFVDHALRHIRQVGRVPDVIHAHYADAGLAGARLAALLSVPMVFTGHSLGREKRRRLLESGQKLENIDKRYHLTERIEAEERALDMASLVVASTEQEEREQYAQYANRKDARIAIIPPGVDLSRFHPYRHVEDLGGFRIRIEKFLRNPRKSWILALARADERKNFGRLVQAFGSRSELRERANLILIAGNRQKIMDLDKGARKVWRDILELIDEYDLYGQVAYPKHHAPDDVPQIYRMAAVRTGIFVNPALTEPFGLTLLEASASGLPVVATQDGGPVEILRHTRNGLLVDPLDVEQIANTLVDALSNGRRWRQWAQRGIRGVAHYYSWTGHAETYLRHIGRIVRKQRKSRSVSTKSRLPTVDRMLINDIDNTLIGDRESLEKLLNLLSSAGDNVAFGVATGRQIDSTLRVLRQWGVPIPDVMITAVGSEIYYGLKRVEDHAWRRHINFRWERQRVLEVLRDVPGLRLQSASEQREHKVSYYVDLQCMPDVAKIHRCLREHGVHVNVIFSHDAYLDILPIRASKGLAVRFVADRWGVSMEHVLVAGDSGNDAEMLSGECLGVVVSNYSSELESLRDRLRIHFAPDPYAAGIIDAIEFYNFLGEIHQPKWD